MRILIAPDKFKGSLEAAEVAAAVAAGIEREQPGARIDVAPVADGGEGTVAAALGAGFRAVTVSVRGPLGDPVPATFACRDDLAVIEMAAASGLGVLPLDADGSPRRDALAASSTGTGELIMAALDAGCREIVLGVGGSAGTDGGAGLLTALGARLVDADGHPIGPGGGGLRDLARVDLTALDPRLSGTRFTLAADVTNPLLGHRGAAAVFGPQKGATPADVELLDHALAAYADRVAEALCGDSAELAGRPGAGAAGGVGYAASAVLGADQRPGIDVVLDFVGFDERLQGVDVVITGEGSLDAQSLGGKTPIGVARRARAHDVGVVLAVCGRSQLSPAQAEEAGFDAVFALADREPDPRRSMREAATLLQRVGAEIGSRLTGPPTTDRPTLTKLVP